MSISIEEHFENMGFAQVEPGMWFREFTHPENGSRFEVTARIHRDGRINVLYQRNGRLHKKRNYTRSPAVTARAIKVSVTNAGFQI